MCSHRYENELAQRQSVEADISDMKRLLDELNLKKNELILQIDTLKEDKLQIQNLHKEVMIQAKCIYIREPWWSRF